MFIEQLRGKSSSLWVYLPFTLGFLGFMGLNIVVTFASGLNSKDMIQDLIVQYGKPLTFVISILPLSVLCFILWGWVKLLHRQSITSLTTARSTIDWKRILFAFVIWSVIMCGFTFYDYFLNPESYEVTFNLRSFAVFFILALLLIPFQTSFEEYFFRGYMMQGLGLATGNRWMPLIITSVLFGLMHGANPEVFEMGPQMLVFYIGTGFFLGIITLMDEGLELALGFHAANNMMACFLVSSDAAALQTDAVLKQIERTSADNMYEIYFQVFLIFPILLFIFAKKYRWKNWKYQLTKKV